MNINIKRELNLLLERVKFWNEIEFELERVGEHMDRYGEDSLRTGNIPCGLFLWYHGQAGFSGYTGSVGVWKSESAFKKFVKDAGCRLLQVLDCEHWNGHL